MSDIIDINVYETTEDITINVTENVIQVNINKVTSSGGGGSWGSITGDLVDQIDLQSALNLKVDKVTGKELSENDFTDTLKSKLDGIEAGAEVNVNADWDSVSGDSEILNKPTIPSIDGLATVTYVDDQDDLKENDFDLDLIGFEDQELEKIFSSLYDKDEDQEKEEIPFYESDIFYAGLLTSAMVWVMFFFA